LALRDGTPHLARRVRGSYQPAKVHLRSGATWSSRNQNSQNSRNLGAGASLVNSTFVPSDITWLCGRFLFPLIMRCDVGLEGREGGHFAQDARPQGPARHVAQMAVVRESGPGVCASAADGSSGSGRGPTATSLLSPASSCTFEAAPPPRRDLRRKSPPRRTG
jgi:hypothetical protein